MDEASLWRLKEEIEREAHRAEEDGFVHLDVGNALKEAEMLLRRYRATKSWEGGYGGRARNYELGFDIDREALLLRAKEFLLRAKGAIRALRLPPWAKELRYYYLDPVWGEESVERLDPRRGVVFMSGRDWALKGFQRVRRASGIGVIVGRRLRVSN